MRAGGIPGLRFLQGSRSQARVASVLVSLTAMLVTVLALEVVLRSTHAFGAHMSWSEPDSLIGFRFTPGLRYWNASENDHRISGTINSHGWRDRERTLEKPPGVYRVAFLGDSFVVAFEVEADSTFLALTEDELGARLERRVEILNCGRSGATQTEEFLVLQRDVMKFAPDAVAVLFNPANDIADVARSTTGGFRPFYVLAPDGGLRLDTRFSKSREYRVRAAINGLKQRSALASLLTHRYNLLRLRTAVRPGDGLPRHLSLCTSHPDSVYVRNYKLNKLLIGEMARYCRRRGVRFLLISGDSVYKTDDILRYSAVAPTFDPDFFETDLAAYADSLGVEHLGLQSIFRQHAEAGGVSLHWGHYNYAGHRTVARALSSKLAGIISNDAPRRPTARGARD